MVELVLFVRVYVSSYTYCHEVYYYDNFVITIQEVHKNNWTVDFEIIDRLPGCNYLCKTLSINWKPISFADTKVNTAGILQLYVPESSKYD